MVLLAEAATSCAVADFEGTHVAAAFDTASGPVLVEAPLKIAEEAEGASD